jgi:hypothetical protein
MVSYRMWLPNRKGRSLLHFRAGEITPKSVVHISATEATALGPPLIDGSQNWSAFIGAASVTVQNVSPGDGVVDFIVNVDWNSPLNITMDITILDPPRQLIVGT